MRIAVAIFGPPGSGKGTQANLLAGRWGIIHFDTGRFLEEILYDPARQKEAIIKKERKIFASGKLSTPSFVTKEIVQELKRLRSAGWGFVFSGSPRTLYEVKKELPVIKRLYGKERMFFFLLNVPESVSARRNKKRFVCPVCGTPFLAEYSSIKHPRHCQVCGSPLHKRSVDDPKIMKTRLREYRIRTEPIFEYIRSQRYPIMEIDGAAPPYKVFEKITSAIRKRLA